MITIGTIMTIEPNWVQYFWVCQKTFSAAYTDKTGLRTFHAKLPDDYPLALTKMLEIRCSDEEYKNHPYRQF